MNSQLSAICLFNERTQLICKWHIDGSLNKASLPFSLGKKRLPSPGLQGWILFTVCLDTGNSFLQLIWLAPALLLHSHPHWLPLCFLVSQTFPLVTVAHVKEQLPSQWRQHPVCLTCDINKYCLKWCWNVGLKKPQTYVANVYRSSSGSTKEEGLCFGRNGNRVTRSSKAPDSPKPCSINK